MTDDSQADVTKHDGLPVSGYSKTVYMVNWNKQLEEQCLQVLDMLGSQAHPDVDKRWLAIGRTQLEQAFMAINRAVFRPERVQLK